MKYLLFLLFLSFSVAGYSQKQKADSVVVSDSTKIISAGDLSPLYKELKKLPYEQSAPLIQYLERLVAVRAEEYKKKNAKQ